MPKPKVQYRFGYYKKPSDHHGRPVFIKYIPTKEPTKSSKDGYTRTPDNLEIVGHVYLLRSTYRRFLSILRIRAARAKNIRRQQLSNAAHASVRSTLSSRS